MTHRPRPLLLFDADCGFCSRYATWVPRLGARVDVASLQDTDLAAVGVDAARAGREMPVVLPDGSIAWGHHAWAETLRTCRQPLRTVGGLLGSRLLEHPASATYAWVASHRQLLPGGTAACAMPPRDAAQAPAPGA